MILAIAFVGVQALVFLAFGGSALAISAIAAAQAAIALLACLLPGARRAMVAVLSHFWPAALAYLFLLAVVAVSAGLLFRPAESGDPYATLGALAALGGLGLAILAAAAAGALSGRFFRGLLLAIGIALAFVVLASNPGPGAPPRTLNLEEISLMSGLIAILAWFAILDETRPMPDLVVHTKRRPLSHRLALPIFAAIASAGGLAYTGGFVAAAAAALGLAAVTAGVALRERGRRSRFLGILTIIFAATPVLGLFVTIDGQATAAAIRQTLQVDLQALGGAWAGRATSGAGLGGPSSGRGVFADWLIDGGLWASACLAAALLLFLFALAPSESRKGIPSRSFALALGALTAAAFHGFAGDGAQGPMSSALLAALLGLAAGRAVRINRAASRKPDRTVSH